jgi:hypothetical protein
MSWFFARLVWVLNNQTWKVVDLDERITPSNSGTEAVPKANAPPWTAMDQVRRLGNECAI